MAKHKVKKMTQLIIDWKKLPNGRYPGVWGGYEVTTTINQKTYILQTYTGIRSPNAPCIVIVENGKIEIEV